MRNLLEIQKQTGVSGDPLLDYVRLDVALRGLDPDLTREVKISHLPQELASHLKKRVALQACYHNTFEAIKKLRVKDCKYVLGFWHKIIPTEHCFLKIGDQYFDPTGELLFEPDEETRYFAVFELEPNEVRQLMRLRGRRQEYPAIHDYVRHIQEQNQTEQRIAA